MKLFHSALPVTLVVLTLTSCEKQNLKPKSAATTLSTLNEKSVVVKLNGGEYELFKTLMSKNNSGARKSLDSLLTSKRNEDATQSSARGFSTMDVDGPVYEEDDEGTFAGNETYGIPGDTYYYDPAGYNTYATQFNAWSQFNKRNLGISVTVPYIYRYNYALGLKPPILAVNPLQSTPISFLSGANVGDIGNKYETLNIMALDGYTARGQANGSFSESRVMIWSTNGRGKLYGEAAATGIKIGAEIEEGFTVQSKENAVTAHSYSVDFTLHISPGPEPFPAYAPQVFWTLKAVNRGVQKD